MAGAFVASLYSEAYLQNDIRSIIEKALLSLPAESGYRRIMKMSSLFHQENPDDWTKCWQMLEDKWARANICNPGTKYNIDAKLNGAYIVIGLLYGEGDINKTLEISTRCGQDSDCNPSNALAFWVSSKDSAHSPKSIEKPSKKRRQNVRSHQLLFQQSGGTHCGLCRKNSLWKMAVK